MANDPPPDLVLTPIKGNARTVREWLTTFHLVFVALDPRAKESTWLLPTARRILKTFEEADCRIAFLVTGDADQARRFLGRSTDEILTFADPDREAVRAFGLQRLPAIVHLGISGSIVGVAEGWKPAEWRSVTANLAKQMAWSSPVVPGARDPGPFEGSPALR